ncbi:carbohydrate kinase family protein [Leekyejoonella antrihumi]|uniref:carbohydrate kinase family protein n=1 Tax=Leekyejoonella antrihumi TaxID=1660198 RepID=UPI001C973CF3|nr:carbohydrate kinase family protein [Leekyejoonella antrihumi]
MRGTVAVIGGANLDIVARSGRPVQIATSNPGRTVATPGGVGRNVAENLARLGAPVSLVAVIGRDDAGRRVLRQTAAAGVDVEHVTRVDSPTGTYTAVLGDDGELVVAIADMAATEAMDVARLPMSLLESAELLVLDGNLPLPVIEHVLVHVGTPVLLDPVSAPKAGRLSGLLDGRHQLHTITPDRHELAALTGEPTGTCAQIAYAARTLLDRGVRRVWVRQGACGSTLITGVDTVHIPAIAAVPVDVTGAGDAMLAAYVQALLTGRGDEDAARDGAAAAYLTITSPHTVRPDLSTCAVERIRREHPAPPVQREVPSPRRKDVI